MSEYAVIEKETGEEIPNMRAVKNINLSPKQIAFINRKNAEEGSLQFWHDQNGKNYTFNITESIKKLFNENDRFTDSEKVHIMYIGSHVNFKKQLMYNRETPMTKKLLLEKISIKETSSLYGFYNKLVAECIILEVNKDLYWNTELCFKGSPQDNNIESINVIRTYDKRIRELYEQTSAKSLPVVFKLLPYTNKITNVLCKNTDARDYHESQPLTIEEIAVIVGGGRIDNFKAKMNRIMIGDDFVFAVTKVGKAYHVRINPMLVWMGGTTAPSIELVGIFKMAKEQRLKGQARNLN